MRRPSIRGYCSTLAMSSRRRGHLVAVLHAHLLVGHLAAPEQDHEQHLVAPLQELAGPC